MDLRDAVAIVDSGKIFSCTVVTYDAKRKTGGKKDFYPEVVCKRRDKSESGVKPTGKPQNHYDNFTRTVVKYQNGQETSVVKKIHLNLLLEVNGKKVML